MRYDYLEIRFAGATSALPDDMWFGFGYELTDRADRYVGYNDYTRDSYGFEFHWSPSRRFDLEATAYYRIYDYPNAFAFHNPIAGPRPRISSTARFSRRFA